MADEVNSISVGDKVKIRLRPGCRGGDRPHNSHENGLCGQVTAESPDDGHPLFVFFSDGVPPSSGLPLGRWFATDELERLR